MITGKIKWYSDAKAFGFIERDGGGDIFFSKSAYSGDATTLKEGQVVNFEIVEKDQGPVAKNIVCK